MYLYVLKEPGFIAWTVVSEDNLVAGYFEDLHQIKDHFKQALIPGLSNEGHIPDKVMSNPQCKDLYQLFHFSIPEKVFKLPTPEQIKAAAESVGYKYSGEDVLCLNAIKRELRILWDCRCAADLGYKTIVPDLSSIKSAAEIQILRHYFTHVFPAADQKFICEQTRLEKAYLRFLLITGRPIPDDILNAMDHPETDTWGKVWIDAYTRFEKDYRE